MASGLGIGFYCSDRLLGGFVAKWLGPDGLFFLYAAPQIIGMILVLSAGAQVSARGSDHHQTWREGRLLLQNSFLRPRACDLSTFFFVPFLRTESCRLSILAVNLRGLNLENVGVMVSVSRLRIHSAICALLCDRDHNQPVYSTWRCRWIPMFLLAGSCGGACHAAIFGYYDNGLWLWTRRATTFALHRLTVALKS